MGIARRSFLRQVGVTATASLELRADRFVTLDQPFVPHHLDRFPCRRVGHRASLGNGLVNLTQGTRPQLPEDVENFQFNFRRLIRWMSRHFLFLPFGRP